MYSVLYLFSISNLEYRKSQETSGQVYSQNSINYGKCWETLDSNLPSMSSAFSSSNDVDDKVDAQSFVLQPTSLLTSDILEDVIVKARLKGSLKYYSSNEKAKA